jgi:uncharacterized protein (DUF111 family)
MLLGALIQAGAASGQIETTVKAWTGAAVSCTAQPAQFQEVHGLHASYTLSGKLPFPYDRLLACCRAAGRYAGSIMERLGEAAAAERGIPSGRLTLEDIGGEQTVAGILAVCAALDGLDVDTLFSAPLPLHAGPASPDPVTARLSVGAAVRPAEGAVTDLAGMAVLTALVKDFEPPPVFTLHRVGYGIHPSRAALLRVCVGEVQQGAGLRDAGEDILVVETNIDDMNPQFYGHVVDRLLEAGALDACLIPMIMKKGRPGTLLTVLAERARVEAITAILLRETTTLGVRMHPVARRVLDRRIVTVETPHGPIRIKVVHPGDHSRYTPEYDDCVRAARTAGVPLADVYEAVRRAAGALDLDSSP